MSSVDKRVVEMQFKNSQFESGAKTTLSTLDKLKQALKLDNASKGLDEVNQAAKKVSLSPLEQAINTVNSRFSTLGVIGTTALANLTNSAVNAGKKLAGALISPLVEGGKRRALNIEQAKFQFEGLGMDVEESMKSANAAVKGTAYGLDSAAKAASQMGASGMQAGENMTKALRAIAGVAAMTGSEYDDISNIFVTVAGNGRLMGDQLLQLSGRGINAAATLGKELGKSEAEIRDMVSKGLIDFETFYTAMDNAFGAHAKDANKTFDGALSNMKAALSRIGADVATPAFENLRDIFNALIPVIDGVHEALNPVIGDIAEAMKQFSEFAVGVLTNLDLSPFTDSMGKARIVLLGFKDGFVNVFKGLSSVIKPIVEAFKNIFPMPTAEQATRIADAVRDLTSKFILSEPAANKVRAVFEGVFSVLKFGVAILGTVAKAFSGLLSILFPIGNAALTIASGIGQAISNLLGAISSFNILDVVITKVSNALSNFSSGLSNMISNIDLAGIVNALSNIFGKIFGAIKDFFNDFDFDSFTSAFLNIFGGTAFAVIATQFSKSMVAIQTALTNLKTKIWSFGNIKSPASILGSVQGALQSWQQNLHASTLIKLAVAIGILSAALTLLSKIPASSLAKSLGAMTVIFAEMMLAFSAFSGALTASKLVGVGKASLALIALATAILILASAVKKMSGIDWSGLAKGLIGVGVALSELVIFTQYVNPKGMITAGIGMMGIATAILVLSAAVSIFAKLNIKEMIIGLSAVAILLGEIVIFSRSFGKLSGILAGASLMVVSTSLIVLGAALKIFASMSLKEIGKGLLTIGGALAILAFGLQMMNGTLKGSAALLVASSALTALAIALRILGSMSIAQIAGALVTMAGSFAIMGVAAIALTSLVPTLLALSVAIGIFGAACLAVGVGMATFAIGLATLAASGAAGATALSLVLQTLISLIPDLFTALVQGIIRALDELAKATDTIINFIASMITAICLAIEKSAAQIVSTVMNVISLLLTAMTERVPEFVDSGMKIVKGILEGIANNIQGVTEAAILVATNFINGIASQLPALIQAGFNLITAFLNGLADAIDRNGSTLNNAIMRLFTSLFSTFALIAASLFVVQKAQTTILLMTAVIAVLALIIKKLSELPVDSVIGIAQSLSTLILSLSASAAILQLVQPAGAAAGVAGLAIVIAGLGTLFAAIGALVTYVPQLQTFVDNAIPLLQSLGTGLGAFLGGIVGGIIDAASSGLVGLGTNLSLFMQELQPFIEGVNSIDEKAIAGVQSLALMVVALAAADFINGLNIFGSVGSSIQSLSENLPLLGQAMNEFAGTIDESNVGKIQSSVEAAKALAEMMSMLPAEGGLFSFFTGGVDIDSLSQSLPKFGEALSAYGESVSGLNSEAVNASIEGAKGLVEVINSMPASGGVAQFFTGGIDMDSMSQNLPKFGDAIKQYGDAVNGINNSAIESSIEGAKGIMELVNALPSGGGVAGFFTGGTDISGFSEQLPLLGQAIKGYSDAIGESFNAEAINASVQSGQNLINLLNQSVGMDYSNASSLSTAVTTFGTALQSFSNSVVGINVDAIANSLYWFGQVKDAMQNFPGEIDSSVLSSFVETLNNAGSESVETFVNTLNEGKSRATDAAREMINSALQAASAAMTSGNAKFMTGGRLWITNLAKGMQQAKQQVISELTNILNECVNKVNEYQNKFAEAGRNIPKGVAQGIDAGKSEAINAAVRMAKESLQAAKDELAINSPSKKFAEIVGRAIPEGTAKGVLKYMYYATDAAREMGDSAISAVSDTLSAINFEFDEMNLEPTITPVLDMSQVEQGMSRFGTEYRIPLSVSSAGLRTSIRNLDRRAELASINQNGSSPTVINNTYDMTQNNYSPKALSRIDIYRQTNNQFSRLKNLNK